MASPSASPPEVEEEAAEAVEEEAAEAAEEEAAEAAEAVEEEEAAEAAAEAVVEEEAAEARLRRSRSRRSMAKHQLGWPGPLRSPGTWWWCCRQR